MAAKLVWILDDGSLSCGHSRKGNGKVGEFESEFWCEMCALHVTAQLDQELEFVAEYLATLD